MFDPSHHVTRIAGKRGSSDYLGARVALAWLRDRHPDAVLETDLLVHREGFALVRCTVRLPSGARATGHGSETAGDFADYLEKAETKAIRRALQVLGFSLEAVRRDRRTEERRRPAPAPRPERLPVDPNAPATPEQFRAVAELARRLRLDGAGLARYVAQAVGPATMETLDHGTARTLIQAMQRAATRRDDTILAFTP